MQVVCEHWFVQCLVGQEAEVLWWNNQPQSERDKARRLCVSEGVIRALELLFICQQVDQCGLVSVHTMKNYIWDRLLREIDCMGCPFDAVYLPHKPLLS